MLQPIIAINHLKFIGVNLIEIFKSSKIELNFFKVQMFNLKVKHNGF